MTWIASLSVVRALSSLWLIDEYELLVHSVFGGKSQFDAANAIEFESESGVVLMKYFATAGAATAGAAA